ncbi:hypothetical protein OBBRIDRAFT_825136 [Obba rivulosa]|uniref:F-box domain-containing protein n=1 Tax=Obba rivulosa TaxID=1052685 RepID=A0A8E2B101_9APHY|nr:hypothetical protein OBBRIDRAFT_825136 [Obba rivulosa]
MHKALFVSEILCQIFEQLEPGPSLDDLCDGLDRLGSSLLDLVPSLRLRYDAQRKLRQRTLSSCARVCQTFSPLALDILWQTQDSFSPLLAVLRRQCAESPVPGALEQVLPGCEPQHPSRAYQYARRVRNITMKTYEWNGLRDDEIIAFIAQMHGAPLFPRLEYLWWDADSQKMLRHPVSHLCCPLRSLRIEVFGPSSSSPASVARAEKMFTQLSPIVSELKALWIQSPDPQGPNIWFTSLPTMFKQCPGLSLFKTRRFYVSMQEVIPLAAFQRLTDLDIVLNDRGQTAPVPKGFPNLRRLKVGGHWSMVKPLLESISSPGLEALDLYSTTYSVEETSVVLSAWTSRFAKSLRSVTLSLDLRLDESVMRCCSFSTLLSDLLVLSDLEDFAIELGNSTLWTISEEDVNELLRAWPRLWSFLISVETSGPLRASVLEGVAQHGRNLRRLYLPMLDMASLQKSAPRTLRQDRLRHIAFPIFRTSRKYIPSFARFARSIFPNLDPNGDMEYDWRSLVNPGGDWGGPPFNTWEVTARFHGFRKSQRKTRAVVDIPDLAEFTIFD